MTERNKRILLFVELFFVFILLAVFMFSYIKPHLSSHSSVTPSPTPLTEDTTKQKHELQKLMQAKNFPNVQHPEAFFTPTTFHIKNGLYPTIVDIPGVLRSVSSTTITIEDIDGEHTYTLLKGNSSSAVTMVFVHFLSKPDVLKKFLSVDALQEEPLNQVVDVLVYPDNTVYQIVFYEN